ncbi:MAG: sigma-E processing peptidase SpoIIGA [Clostridia bacterium]|nr:sigma-E processing peptidase SpoIIGA [Clostridia bacterium]
MVIYGDILFIVNMTVDYLLLGLTALILKREILLWRQIAAAAIGGISSFYIFIETENFFLDILFRIVVSAAMALIAFGFKSIRKFIRVNILTLILSLLLSGIAEFLASIFKSRAVILNNTVLYIGISPIILISVSVAFYFSVKLFFRIKKNSMGNEILTVKISIGNKEVSFMGLVDTGNTVTDPLSNSEILIVSKNVIGQLCGCDIDEYFEILENKARCRLIPVGTVGGNTLLKAVRSDKAVITGRESPTILKNPIIALSKQNFLGEYEIIIPEGAMKGR